MENHIKESTEYCLGLPISNDTIHAKLQASEVAENLLREKCFTLHSELKEKVEVMKRSEAESNMNAFALNKFVEENRKLTLEYVNLLNQYSEWEKECASCDNDRVALMEFGDKAHERAKEAEAHTQELEGKLRSLSKELKSNKVEKTLTLDDTCAEFSMEEEMLNSILSSTTKDEAAMLAHAFLGANNGIEPCQQLLEKWNSLRPSTQNVISLVVKTRVLKRDMEHLRFNLLKAEKEVIALDDENKMLNEEKRMLVRRPCGYEQHSSTSPKLTHSAPAKHKRRQSTKLGSPIEKRIDFGDINSPRKILVPLRQKFAP